MIFGLSTKRSAVCALAFGAVILPAVNVALGQQAATRPLVHPPNPIVLPVPGVRRLPNGLRVILIERHSTPLISVNAMVMSGAEADPPGQAGMAQMVAGLLPEGTERRNALEIAQIIDDAGGSIDSGAGWDKSFVTVSTLSNQQNMAFDVLSDVLIHPTFQAEEIERLRKQTLSALRVLWQDPSYVADIVTRHLMFAGTPYGHPDDGTVESLGQITRRDLQKFHRTYYLPNNTVLAVLGDISPEACFRLATKYFASWQGGELPIRSSPAKVAAPATRSVVVIDKPDAVQTEIRVASLGVPRASPDFYPLTIANQVLGGPAANRLFQTLRTERGLTYGASSELDCYRDVGAWVAKTSTRTDETATALEVILQDMKQLSHRPINSQELQMARNYLIGHQALEFEPIDGIAAQTFELMLYGLPLDSWNRLPEEIERLNTGDVENAASRYLHPDREIPVLVGNSSAFERHLERFGRVKVIPIGQIDLESSTLERSPSQAAHP